MSSDYGEFVLAANVSKHTSLSQIHTVHTVKIFTPLLRILTGVHCPRSSNFEISPVKQSLLKSMLIIFSLSLSFDTLPLSSPHLALLQVPLFAMHCINLANIPSFLKILQFVCCVICNCMNQGFLRIFS